VLKEKKRGKEAARVRRKMRKENNTSIVTGGKEGIGS